jgi:hypothetical protein
MKRLKLSCGLYLYCIMLSAQDIKPPKDTYFFLGLGLPLTTIRDEAHSPLKYRAFTPTLRAGLENINGDFISRLSISASMTIPPMFGSAKPKTRPKPEGTLSSMELSNVQINYAYYSSVNSFSKAGWNPYLGGVATMTFDLRGYNLPSNNLLGYQINFSLNAGGFVQKQMNDKSRFNYELFTPLVSYSLRPTYLGMLPTKGSETNPKNVFLNGKIVTLDKLFRLYNRLSIDQQIKPYRARRFFYSWDFHSNTISKPLKSVMGGVGYESLFKI